jgi:hypothetical protein
MTSVVVPLIFGSDTYPTKEGVCVEFADVSTGAAATLTAWYRIIFEMLR